jgi:hypothetical protein
MIIQEGNSVVADHLFVISEDSNLRTTLLTIAVIAFPGACGGAL